ncbi:MAG: bifunctional oligoribonuclease/PAP phosphatase NrnA [Bacteroidetes bacterium]|nr:bifunctional oligoribonuclease/PAP phosphatase NrnA [Bacteroidota bacterium]
MIEFNKIKSIFDTHSSFIITSHVNPDADAIGSELALCYYLKSLGKSVRIINFSETPAYLNFLDEENLIEHFKEALHAEAILKSEVILVVDLNQLSRTMEMEKHIRKSKAALMCIDHHENTEKFSEDLFVDIEYTSTGEIVYELLASDSSYKMDYKAALNLYAAIMTDTGSFKYDRTSSRTHRIAAHLLELGVNPRETHNKIYDQGSKGKLQLLGRALSSFSCEGNGKIGIMTITKKDIGETKTVEADIDGFINHCLTVSGVVIAIFFVEIEDGIKISFRSIGNIPVNKLAGEFGGGGHFNASGARFPNGKLDEIKLKVIEAAKKYIIE